MRISPEAESRVLQAAQESGYRPNILSRSLRTGTSRTIGFVSDTVATTPFAGHLIWGALDAARDQGHLLIIGETEGDPELEQELIDAMHDRGVDGIVLASMYTRELELPRSLQDGPAVLLNAIPTAVPPPIPCVVPDEFGAGQDAVRILLEAGHTDRIALIGAAPPDSAPKSSLAAIQRLDGIMHALDQANITLIDAIACPDWQPSIGYDAASTLLKRTRPSALICFNDRLALGAYQAISECGLVVPDGISVVSFDDDLIATWLRPQLTSIALPHYDLGRASIDALLSASETDASKTPAILRIPMPVRERESVQGVTARRPSQERAA